VELLPETYGVEDVEDSLVAVLDWLAALDDKWRGFHSVPFIRWDRRGNQRSGEADLILTHPAHGAIGIEAKGGFPIVRGNQWYPDDRHPRSPMDQARDAMWWLLAEKQRHANAWLPYVCLIAGSSRFSGV
jgi:hypothetical protein